MTDASRFTVDPPHDVFLFLPTQMQSRDKALVSEATKLTGQPLRRKGLPTSFPKNPICPTHTELLCTCSLFSGKRKQEQFCISSCPCLWQASSGTICSLRFSPPLIFLFFQTSHFPEGQSHYQVLLLNSASSVFFWGAVGVEQGLFACLFCLCLCIFCFLFCFGTLCFFFVFLGIKPRNQCIHWAVRHIPLSYSLSP